MQRHQLHLIQLFFTLSTLHHVAQSKAGNDLGQGHRLFQLTAFQHLRHPAEQRIDVFHTHFSRFRARRGFIQPGFVINTVDQIAHSGNRFALRQALNFTQPVRKAGQRVIPAPGQCLAKPHIKAGGKQAFITRHRPFTQLLQRGRTDFTLWRVYDAQKCAVVIRVAQHAQVGQQIFNLRTREERCSAGNFVRDTVLHQKLFEHARLMITAIKDGVVFILRLVHKVMGN